MSASATVHQRPEHQPLADACRHLACACSAMRAAVHHQPELAQHLGDVHALVADAQRSLAEIVDRTERRS